MTPFAYQQRAVDEVARLRAAGAKSVCLVAPTGSGKSFMGRMCLQGSASGLWMVHTNDLLEQAKRQIEEAGLPVQVATVQGLLASGHRPPAEVVITDECHHYSSDHWQLVREAYQDAFHLGLTATPERADGRPLEYEHLVVAATYSELIREGRILPVRIFGPPTELSGLAASPVTAWQEWGEGATTFAFASTVEHCEKWAKKMNAAGIRSCVISGVTPKAVRRTMLELLASGEIRVAWSVFALTEGVDVPRARCCLLTTSPEFGSRFLQMVGRVLRSYRGQTQAILIDLCGATYRHGSPVWDREYSLAPGTAAIRPKAGQSIRQCLRCGIFSESWTDCCPHCGWRPPPNSRPLPRIYSQELRELYAGQQTPEDAKNAEYARLRSVQQKLGATVDWVVKQYKLLFFERVVVMDASPEERAALWTKLQGQGRRMRNGDKVAIVRYRDLVGCSPFKDDQLKLGQSMLKAAKERKRPLTLPGFRGLEN